MSSLETLFRLELEFHRTLRTITPGHDDGSLHTSYALHSGYDQLLVAIPFVTDRQLEQLRDRFLHAANPRDVLAAHDSVSQLLGLCPAGV